MTVGPILLFLTHSTLLGVLATAWLMERAGDRVPAGFWVVAYLTLAPLRYSLTMLAPQFSPAQPAASWYSPLVGMIVDVGLAWLITRLLFSRDESSSRQPRERDFIEPRTDAAAGLPLIALGLGLQPFLMIAAVALVWIIIRWLLRRVLTSFAAAQPHVPAWLLTIVTLGVIVGWGWVEKVIVTVR